MNINKKCAAEFVGTFYLCFAGISAILCDQLTGGQVGLLGIALAHGIALSIGVAVTGGISGGHLNPAVTVGLLVTRKIEPPMAGKYILSQLAGATFAALVCQAIFQHLPGAQLRAAIPLPGVIEGVGTTPENFGMVPVLMAEFVMTFLLVTSVYSVAVDTRGKAVKIGAFAIGLTVTFCILAGGSVSGASMNPARSFGPALVNLYFVNHWYYWVAPILGGIAGGLFYQNVLLEDETSDSEEPAAEAAPAADDGGAATEDEAAGQ
ncbi:MAG: MIP/aquaporin family protein [Pirellulaceae bacterium]